MPTFSEVDHDPFAAATPTPAPATSAPAVKASPLDSALAAENTPAPVAAIARSIYQQESGSGRNTKTSNAGAVGGMQVIPSTFKSVADQGWDINNPEHNARAGVRYISQMYDKAGGDPALTAAGYYGGPGGLEKARQGVAVADPRNPNAPTTLQYGQQVAARIPKSPGPTFTEVDHDPFAQPAAAAGQAAPVATPAPEDNSFLSNLGSGIKKGVTDVALGAKQRLDEGAAALENTFGGQPLNKALGLQNAADIKPQTQALVDQKRIDDAPLMKTVGGQVGDFLGGIVPAAAAMFIPGGQTLAGSVAANGILGLAQPTATGESVTGNAAAGAAGGALGYGVGKGISALAGKFSDSAAAKAVLNAPKDTIAATARDAGYAIPPTQTNPGFINSTLEGLSGKIKTAQKASVKNQDVTNRLAAESLGLDPAQPITKDALNGIRRNAGQAYDAVSNAGQITPTASYTQALDDIARPYVQAAQGFPNAAPHPVLAQIDGLRSPTFDAASAVAKIKSLRAQADTAYRGGDKEVGGALKSGANALEDAIDTHLASTGAPADVLSNFRNARQTIAKTYSVENALNDTTGNINAGKLASQLARGKPLSGDLKTIAQVGQAFPTAAKEVTSSMPGVSPLDFFAAAQMAAKSTLGGAASIMSLGARPLLRAGILSKPYQNTLATPSYNGSALLNGLSSMPARAALTAGGQQAGRQIANGQPGFADGGLIGDDGAQQGQQSIADAQQLAQTSQAIGQHLAYQTQGAQDERDANRAYDFGQEREQQYKMDQSQHASDIGDAQAAGGQALYTGMQLAQEGQAQGAQTVATAAATTRGNENIGLESMGYHTEELGYANGGLIVPDPYAVSPGLDVSPGLSTPNEIPDIPAIARQAAPPAVPNALNTSAVSSIMGNSLGIDAGSPIHSLFADSAFNQGGSSKIFRSFKNGGLIGAPEMSGAIRALAFGRSQKAAAPASAAQPLSRGEKNSLARLPK